MKNRKKILALGLIFLIVILGIATIFISSRISGQKSVAPTAPSSQPKAATGVLECGNCSAANTCLQGLTCDSVDGKCKKGDGSTICWSSPSAACTLNGKVPCTPTGVITCSPDCPTECGRPSSTINTCTNSCGVATTKNCEATPACDLPILSIVKKAYLDNAVPFKLVTEINSVSTDQTFVYNIVVKNTGTTTATNATVTDILSGQNQNNLTFKDVESKCTYTATSKTITCPIVSLAPSASASFSFRMTAKGDVGTYAIEQGDTGPTIKNTAKVVLGTVIKSATKNLIYSSAACTPTSIITCDPDCVTTCGATDRPATEISTCKNSCGTAVKKTCPAVAACLTGSLTIVKKAFWDETGNVAGNYDLKTEIDTLAKNQTFVYSIEIKNTGEVAAPVAIISDTLSGENQDILTFVDADTGCTYSATDKKVTCAGITLAADASAKRSFRMKLSADAANGVVIKNTGSVVYGSTNKNATKDLTVSTVVGCNHTCTSDDECTGSLVCDESTSKCRNSACLQTAGCTCPTATATPTATVTATSTPTATLTDAPIATTTIEPTVLPETGILDFPGVAAFGGGLLLAIIGILLAF